MVNGNGIIRGRQGREVPGANPVLDRRLDEARDGAKPDLAADEGSHRHLIGGIEYRGGATAGAQRVVGQPQTRKTLEIRRLERQLPDLGEIEPGGRTRDSIRPAEAMRDRRAHVRRPQLRDHRYYSALLGSVEVISLDCTTSTDKTGEQAAWFGEQLDRIPPQVEFLVILDHYPWMADWQSQLFAHLPDKPALVLREVLEAHLPKLQAKVLVFNGHIHNYERFQRNGVTYVVTGGGGAQPYPVLIRGGEDQYLDKGFPVYHYLTIDVVNHQLHAVMWKVKDPEAPTLDVEAKDQFTLTYTPRREQGSSGP